MISDLRTAMSEVNKVYGINDFGFMKMVNENMKAKAAYMLYQELKKLGYLKRHFNSNYDWSVNRKNWAIIIFNDGNITIK